MSAEFRPTSHQESADEIIKIPDGQEIMEDNKPSEYESIDETTAGSYYIDDVNPASNYQALEGSQSEANDYECIAGTNPAYDYIEVITEPRTLTSKCKKTILFLVPIFASVIVNITVGSCASLMILPRVDLRGTSSKARRTVPEVLISFCMFSALAAASCAPLIMRYGFRKVALGGSVLHICSSGISSLTTTSDIWAILFGIIRGTAVGLLRTIGVVATVDHLYTHPALALVISHTSFTVGNIIGITATLIGFTYKWDVEITAMIGLVAGSFLQMTQQNLPKLFKHPPFYFLISIRLAASVGLSILLPEIVIISTILIRINNWLIVICLFASQLFVLIVLVTILIFQKNKLKKSALLLMGISVLAVGLVMMAHQVTFGSTWAVILLLGAATALSQIMLPSALANTTGRSNLKLSLPVLGCFVEIGGLISSSLLTVFEQLPYRDDQANGAFYFGGVSLIIVGVCAIIAWVLMKRWTPLSDESEEEDHVEDCVEEAGDHVGETEDHVGDTEDHVEETEDHVEETEDHVEDRVEEAEDRVEEIEDHVEETEDHVGDTEDHVEETEDHVEETEDHVEETGDTGEMETKEPGK